jgi:hypothetical protein
MLSGPSSHSELGEWLRQLRCGTTTFQTPGYKLDYGHFKSELFNKNLLGHHARLW